jgi:hypothetical protein
MGEWLFSRRDGAIVAWHELPGILRPIIPYPAGRFSRGTLSQALRAWLRSACPSGTKPFFHRSASELSQRLWSLPLPSKGT